MLSARKNSTGKPHLLIILNRLVIAGQAADIIPLAWYLNKDFEILILYGEKEKNQIEPTFLLQKYPGLNLKKTQYLKRSLNPFIDIAALFYILYVIVKFKPKIVHTHGSKPGVLGRLAAWAARVPVIIHTYHGHFFHSYFSKVVSWLIVLTERALGKITTCAIALSESQKNDLASEYKILPSSKIAIIPLGFDSDENKEDITLRENFREKYNLQQEDVAIGIVGRIVSIKNHTFFVKIIQRILSDNPVNPPAFFIIGDGDLRLKIEDDLRQRNIHFGTAAISPQARVIFTSWITNIAEVMNGLDIVVLTSLNEGTPLSVIEAQYFKKPVVVTDAGGVKDSLQNDVTGYLVDKNNITLFCKKLSLLIDNKELRVTMGEAGNKFVADKYSKQKEVTGIKNLYFNLLRRKGFYKN